MFPATDHSTVHRYILMSIQVADKLYKKYSFITTNLAAAKVALDITGLDPGKFSNVVIPLGAFHIMCS